MYLFFEKKNNKPAKLMPAKFRRSPEDQLLGDDAYSIFRICFLGRFLLFSHGMNITIMAHHLGNIFVRFPRIFNEYLAPSAPVIPCGKGVLSAPKPLAEDIWSIWVVGNKMVKCKRPLFQASIMAHHLGNIFVTFSKHQTVANLRWPVAWLS